jgi:Isochorismatase family
MTQHFGRPGASPLIAPTVCSLVLLAPTRQDLTKMTRQRRTNVRRNFVTIMSAANIVGVPSLVYSPCNEPAKHGFASCLQHVPLRDALSEQDRSALVLAGFWLEHLVVASALHALVDSYDVYLVLDASPAKMQGAVRLSQDRLIQAGATPVVVSQVIHEWSLETADAAKAAALHALLLSPSTTEEG